MQTEQIHKDYRSAAEFHLTFYSNVVVNESDLSKTSEKINRKIATYNTDFVNDNLKWLLSEDGELKPFAIIGKENLEIDKKIIPKERRLEREEITLPRVDSTFKNKLEIYRRIDNRVSDLLTSFAREIRNNANYYGEFNYNKPKLEKEIETYEANIYKVLTKEEVEGYIKELGEDDKEIIDYELEKIENLERKISLQKINDLLTKEISLNKVVDEWINDAELTQWIKDAYNIHKNKLEKCQFCGGKLEDDIFIKIDNHFSKEAESLEKEIIKQLSILGKLKDKLIKVELNSGKFLTRHKLTVEKTAENLERYIADFNIQIDYLIEELENRKKNLFRSREKIEFKLDENIGSINNEIKEIVIKHNEDQRNVDDRKQKIKEKLRKNKVLETYESFMEVKDCPVKSYDEAIKEKNAAYETMKIYEEVLENKNKRIDILKSKIEKLYGMLDQEQATADKINDFLNYFFKNEAIKMKYIKNSDEGAFQVFRNYEVANNLSEGERRIISFCYFLTSVFDELQKESSKEKLIIYIDDPISSLDTNHIFSIFSIIDSLIVRNGNYKQLFIATHNLDFLKYLKRLNIEKENVNFYQIEKLRKERDGNYKSHLTKMHSYLEEYTTEFHYLFQEMYELYKNIDSYPVEQMNGRINNSYSMYYNIPNITRRFLEVYLFYKYPRKDTLFNKIISFTDSEQDAVFINRIINEYSHTTSLERATKPIELNEIKECLEIIMQNLELKDEKQYNELIKIGK